MTKDPKYTWTEKSCGKCISWQCYNNTEVGICDNVNSLHNQHLITQNHPACSEYSLENKVTLEELKEDVEKIAELSNKIRFPY